MMDCVRQTREKEGLKGFYKVKQTAEKGIGIPTVSAGGV
jgi:hypothetical protein